MGKSYSSKCSKGNFPRWQIEDFLHFFRDDLVIYLARVFHLFLLPLCSFIFTRLLFSNKNWNVRHRSFLYIFLSSRDDSIDCTSHENKILLFSFSHCSVRWPEILMFDCNDAAKGNKTKEREKEYFVRSTSLPTTVRTMSVNPAMNKSRRRSMWSWSEKNCNIAKLIWILLLIGQWEYRNRREIIQFKLFNFCFKVPRTF